MVSAKHSGFIVNVGKASSQDVLQLMEQVRSRVYQDSGIVLEPEIRIIKEDDGWNL
jgi:UDP-N-acetylmuramate dehydrogenase